MLLMVTLALSAVSPLDDDFARWFLNAPQIVSRTTTQRRRQLIRVWRTRTTALQWHQEQGNRYNLDAATASVIYECRLRSSGWLVRVEDRIRQIARANVRLFALGHDLSADEREAEQAYNTWTSLMHRQFLLSDGGCAGLIGKPFLRRFDAMGR
jgi:hypothetical protein